MRAAVTGSTGFVGPHLCAHLRVCGDDVVELGDERGKFDITDRDAVFATLARSRPEVVYHLAAASHVGESWTDPVGTWRVNLEGTLNVCDAARAAGVRRVLVVGTAEEYGAVDPAEVPIREDTALRPSSPYGASKVAASFAALQANLAGGIETVRVRAFNHTGPGQAPRFLIPVLADRIALAERDGHDDIAVGSLDPIRDISDVRDIVRGYRLAMEHGTAGDVYNVCSGVGHSVREVADRLLAQSTRTLRLVQDPALVRPVDVPCLIGDNTRLVAATAWSPTYTLDETLREVLEEARSRA